MRRFALLLVCALLFVSCSDSGTSVGDDPNVGIPVGEVTKTITPDGGTIRTRASEGGPAFTMVFPAGAVRSPIAITLNPLAPGAGLWFDLALEPAGLVFFEEVELTVELPEGTNLSQAQMMFLRPDDPVYVPTSVNSAGGTITTSLKFFGFTDDGTLTIASSPGAQLAPQAGGNNLGGGPVDCQAVIASAKLRFDTFVSIGLFEKAVDAALEISGIAYRATCFAEASDWIDMAADIACTKLTEALADAASTPTSAYGDFNDQVEQIITWVAIAVRVNPSCPALDTWEAGLGNEVGDFLAFFQPRLNALTANDWATFADLKDEAISARELQAQAEMMGLSDGATLIEEQAFKPAVDQMRTVAFNMCKSGGWHYPLSRLTATGFFARRDIVGVTPPRAGSMSVSSGYASFSDSDIFKDMQMCGTSADVKTKVSSGTEYSSAHFEATAPGSSTNALAINCPTRGTIILDGKIAAFSCWDSKRADDEITVNFNSTDVHTLPRPAAGNEYIDGTPVELDILQIAQASGFTPSGGDSTELVLTRNRADCDDRMWGSGDQEVFRATLRWKNPTLDMDVVFPDTVDAGAATPVTVKVKVIDLLGQAGFFDAIDLVLNVNGGTAAATSGQTDSNGEFTTTITADAPSPSPGGPGGSSAPGFSVSATATSFEGVTAQKTETATVLACDAKNHRIREGGSGNHTVDGDYRDARVWASAPAGEYHYATHEAIDDFIVTPSDASLIGQRGYVYIKVRYRYQSSGYSTSNPAARVVIGPRNGYSSPYFFTKNFGTPTDGHAQDVTDEWEIPVSCTFGRVSAPLDVNTDVYAKAGDDGPSMVSIDLTWIGITKVTLEDRTTVVGSYKICSGSGTDYR